MDHIPQELLREVCTQYLSVHEFIRFGESCKDTEKLLLLSSLSFSKFHQINLDHQFPKYLQTAGKTVTLKKLVELFKRKWFIEDLHVSHSLSHVLIRSELLQLKQLCHKLSCLSVSGNKHCGVNQINIDDILRLCPKLTELHLMDGYWHLEGNKTYNNLTLINLSGSYLTPDFVQSIKTVNNSVHTIILQRIAGLNNEMLIQILKQNPNLTSLDIAHNYNIKDNCFDNLKDVNAQHLRHVNMAYCKDITDPGVFAIYHHFPALTCLNTVGCIRISLGYKQVMDEWLRKRANTNIPISLHRDNNKHTRAVRVVGVVGLAKETADREMAKKDCTGYYILVVLMFVFYYAGRWVLNRLMEINKQSYMCHVYYFGAGFVVVSVLYASLEFCLFKFFPMDRHHFV